MLEYRPKCLDFMKTVGSTDYNVRVDRITSTILVDLVEQCRTDRDNLRQEQFLRCNEYKQKLESFADHIISKIGLRMPENNITDRFLF